MSHHPCATTDYELCPRARDRCLFDATAFYRNRNVHYDLRDERSLGASCSSVRRTLDAIKYHWKIRIKIQDEKHLTWEDIKFEPNKPYLTHDEISKMCNGLLGKYQAIEAIQIMDVDPHSMIKEFKRI